MKEGRPAGGEIPAAALGEEPFEGRLARAVRMPVRIVALVLVVPVRMVWDALTVSGRALRRVVWVPLARAGRRAWRSVLAPVLHAVVVWPWLALWRYAVAPVARAIGWLARAAGAGAAWAGRRLRAGLAWLGRRLLLEPLSLLYECVLTPLGRGAAAFARAAGVGLAWLGRTLVVVPSGFLHRRVLKPAGIAVLAVLAAAGAGAVWLWRWLVVAPCGFAYRWVLTPVGRCVAVVAGEVADAVAQAWRVAGHVSRAVWRFFRRVLRFLIADPLVWLWRYAVRPAGRALRDAVWRPVAEAVREAGRGVRSALAAARHSVRQTRAELRRALFGVRPAARPPQGPRGRGREARPGSEGAVPEPTRTLDRRITAQQRDDARDIRLEA